ncbi:PWI domain-containing protein [Niveomyces insectorum RCEF 264]|uniref:PWI domain-containing protein n=1 Tax=Niveomyces insectorum RCEF 264 TaxID=1081102 RepID=A0A167MTX4_9HYPO|nr:PWI domain-containing protein [Niveomyces insectorum RCEF 264]
MATGVDAKLLKSTKFPPIFNQKVDMQKVNLQVMKKWIAGKIADILGNDDDVVIELCYNLIESSRNPDIKALQIQLTGFLESHTPEFCKELWTLLLSAQTSPQGIPRELLEAKKMELIQEKIEAEKAAEEARKKREESGRFDRDRPLRGGARGGGGAGGDRGDRVDSWRGGGGGRRGNDNRRGGGGGGGGGAFALPLVISFAVPLFVRGFRFIAVAVTVTVTVTMLRLALVERGHGLHGRRAHTIMTLVAAGVSGDGLHPPVDPPCPSAAGTRRRAVGRAAAAGGRQGRSHRLARPGTHTARVVKVRLVDGGQPGSQIAGAAAAAAEAGVPLQRKTTRDD